MKRTILIFGFLSIVILLLFQLDRWSLFTLSGYENLYVIITGVLFLILGMVMSRFVVFQTKKRKDNRIKTSLSEQELNVVHLMADGLSNKEIAERLFIAESTVKSHVSNILLKLNARRRTEALKVCRDLGVI